ncbi:MAG: hypothetical protein QM769_04885 [Pseudoxanthomonas sp.]
MFPGSALPLALEVHRDPSRIEATRRAVLPVDIGRLLLLLSGHDERLRQAAADTDVDEAQLLAAARFYVRETMLHTDADDARMLGLGPGSGPGDLKRHYHALQAWLHPDRNGAPADAQALSARVNVAWSRLRDQRAMLEPETEIGRFWPRWRRVEEPDARFTGVTSRIAGAVAGVVVLAVLAWWVGTDTTAPATREPTFPVTTATQPGQATEAILPSVATTPVVAAPTTATVGMSQSELGGSIDPIFPAASRTPEPPVPPAVSVYGQETPVVPDARDRPSLPLAAKPTPDVLPVAVAPIAVAIRKPPAIRPTALSITPPPVALAVADPDLEEIARLRNAQMLIHADTLYDYLAQPGGSVPPIWHSGAALDQADKVRRVLIASGAPGRPRLLRAQALWHFHDDQAELRVPVTPAAGHGTGRQTLLTQWLWKNGAWWVTQVALEET